MNVFKLRDRLVGDYSSYISSFIQIQDERIQKYVDEQLEQGLLWPDPLIQLNPSFKPGVWIDDLVAVFRVKPDPNSDGKPLRLHTHQEEAIRIACRGHNSQEGTQLS